MVWLILCRNPKISGSAQAKSMLNSTKVETLERAGDEAVYVDTSISVKIMLRRLLESAPSGGT